MSLILACIALALNLATLCILLSTERKMRRTEKSLDALEAALKGRRP